MRARGLRRRGAIAALSLVAMTTMMLAGMASPAHAAELLMFELDGCPWCKLWHREVGPGYPLSPEGQRAPLRIVDIKAPLPPGLVLDKPVTSSPTFVLVEGNREVGRITGYPGADFFWPLLDELIGKLEPSATAAPVPQRAL